MLTHYKVSFFFFLETLPPTTHSTASLCASPVSGSPPVTASKSHIIAVHWSLRASLNSLNFWRLVGGANRGDEGRGSGGSEAVRLSIVFPILVKSRSLLHGQQPRRCSWMGFSVSDVQQRVHTPPSRLHSPRLWPQNFASFCTLRTSICVGN